VVEHIVDRVLEMFARGMWLECASREAEAQAHWWGSLSSQVLCTSVSFERPEEVRMCCCNLELQVMDQRKPPEYILEVFADPTCVKDIVRGMSAPYAPFSGD